MQLSASGKVRCQLEIMSLSELNNVLDKIKGGAVLGKIVLDVNAGPLRVRPEASVEHHTRL